MSKREKEGPYQRKVSASPETIEECFEELISKHGLGLPIDVIRKPDSPRRDEPIPSVARPTYGDEPNLGINGRSDTSGTVATLPATWIALFEFAIESTIIALFADYWHAMTHPRTDLVGLYTTEELTKMLKRTAVASDFLSEYTNGPECRYMRKCVSNYSEPIPALHNNYCERLEGLGVALREVSGFRFRLEMALNEATRGGGPRESAGDRNALIRFLLCVPLEKRTVGMDIERALFSLCSTSIQETGQLPDELAFDLPHPLQQIYAFKKAGKHRRRGAFFTQEEVAVLLLASRTVLVEPDETVELAIERVCKNIVAEVW